MKILYATYARLPTRKAHGLQIIKTCEALTSLGVEVVLLVALRRGSDAEEIHRVYDIKNRFVIHAIHIPSFFWLGRVGFWLSEGLFAWRVRGYIRREKPDIVYSRDELPLLVSPREKIKVYEAHTPRWNLFTKWLVDRVDLFISITGGLERWYQSKGVSGRMAVVPDAVSVSQFRNAGNHTTSRLKCGISESGPIVSYIGQLYSEKGAWLLAEAARYLPGDIHFYFVGGWAREVDRFRAKYGQSPNIHITGYVPHNLVPSYMAGSQVLVLPNTLTDEISSNFTSPMKLFEYMASGVPIVAADVPAVREILTEETALFFEADKPKDLAAKIQEIINHSEQAIARSEKAQIEVLKYSWQERARKISNLLESIK
ncbi:MAG: glycosyltransferase family 4 protein [Candidatus Paceibacterota bacterium]